MCSRGKMPLHSTHSEKNIGTLIRHWLRRRGPAVADDRLAGARLGHRVVRGHGPALYRSRRCGGMIEARRQADLGPAPRPDVGTRPGN